MKQKIYNTLYGAIVADALGVPVEFKDRDYLKENPVTDMVGYGTYNLPKGSWSDDSSMMLCLADSFVEKEGLDYEDIMKRFWDWFKHSKYTPDHDTFDIGRTCQTAIQNFHNGTAPLECGLQGERDNGNGSLMRIAPLPLYLFNIYGDDVMSENQSFEIIHNVSRLTHAHPISLIGCDIYCAIMIEILKGTKKEDLLGFALPKIGKFVKDHPEYESALQKYFRITHLSFKDIPEKEIQSSGYVVDSLEAALWCFLNTDNYRDCVLKAVNLGYDTDSVACIAGSIAGAYYGDVPQEWTDCLRNRKLVDKIINAFSAVLIRPKLYLDMDGTLVDFVSQVNKYGFWRTDKENKVDWKKVKEIGSRFWSEMDWIPGAEEAFTKLQKLEAQGKLELFILSSIDFDSGRQGKEEWILQKTNFTLEKVIFCIEPEDKAKWAAKNAWLIDDRKKSLEPFKAAGGNIIEFKGDWTSILERIDFYIED